MEKANARTDVDMARAIYDHVVPRSHTTRVAKVAGRGDIYYGSKERRGDCVDFDAIFIGYSRAVGIPARYALGFALPAQRGEGKIPEYHGWAEFHAKGIGWVPVDAAEAAQHPSSREYYFGTQDENRIELTNGRDPVLAPKQRCFMRMLHLWLCDT